MRVRMLWGRSLLGAALAGVYAFAWFPSVAQDNAHWRSYETMLVSKGLMRTDRNPSDVRYSNMDLVNAFDSIMLRAEHGQAAGQFVKKLGARTLKKLDSEVRISISGSTIGGSDMGYIRATMDRLRRATGVDLIESHDDPTIQLMILTENEREEFARQAAGSQRWNFMAQNVADDLGRAVCATYYSRDDQRPESLDYIVVIPAEVTGLLRQSCIEEELGQTFGAGADSDFARPSVFNDNAEFALLTQHDEELLRILYDPRLKAGMTAEQAIPIALRVAEELRPGQ